MTEQDMTGQHLHLAKEMAQEPTMEADNIDATGSSDFSIDSPESANWLVRKVKESRAYSERVRAWAHKEAERANKEEAWLLERYSDQLRQWVEAELQHHRRRRSLSLPAGTVGVRAEPERVVVSDEPALFAWCKSNLNEAVRVRVDAVGAIAISLMDWTSGHCPEARCIESVAKAEVNAYIAETGDMPKGTEVLGRKDVLYIR